MPPQTPELEEVLEEAIEARLESVYTAMPGRVVSFDRHTSTVNVQPTIKKIYKREDGTEVAATLPVIPNVPLLFPGSGALFGMTYPIKKGHHVLLIVCSESLDAWKLSSGDKLVAPKNFKPHALGNAVAITGLRTMPASDAADATYVDEDTMCLNAPAICLGGFTTDIDDSVARRRDLEPIVTKLNDLIEVFWEHFHPASAGTTSPPTPSIPPMATMDLPDCSDITKAT